MVVNLHRLDINAFFLSVHYILYYNKHWRIPACESSRTRTQFNIFCQYCNLPYSFLVDPTAISIFALLDVTDIFHETLQESVAACGFFVSSPLDTLTLVADIASTQLHSIVRNFKIEDLQKFGCMSINLLHMTGLLHEGKFHVQDLLEPAIFGSLPWAYVMCNWAQILLHRRHWPSQ